MKQEHLLKSPQAADPKHASWLPPVWRSPPPPSTLPPAGTKRHLRLRDGEENLSALCEAAAVAALRFHSLRQAERRAVFTHSNPPAGHSRRCPGAVRHLAVGETPLHWIPEPRLRWFFSSLYVFLYRGHAWLPKRDARTFFLFKLGYFSKSKSDFGAVLRGFTSYFDLLHKGSREEFFPRCYLLINFTSF